MLVPRATDTKPDELLRDPNVKRRLERADLLGEQARTEGQAGGSLAGRLMGLGDIVALALGGYAFVARFPLTRDRMAHWDGYEMLFVCGTAGVLLLVATWPVAYFVGDVLCLMPKDSSVWTIAGILGIPVGFALASTLNWQIRLLRYRN